MVRCAVGHEQQHLVISDAIFEAIHKSVAITPRAARRRTH
jgi:hypothetical protein